MKLRLVLLFSLAAGCSGSEPVPMTFSDINKQVFSRSCANFSSCHCNRTLVPNCAAPGSTSVGKLDLATDPYTALVNAPAYNALASSQGLLRVKPGDPTNSFLMIKLQLPLASTDDGGYQLSMPSGNPHLPDVDLNAIAAWITMGAPNN